MRLVIYFLFLALMASSCNSDSDILNFSSDGFSNSQSQSGIAGSYARFLTIGDYLYIIDNLNLKTFSTADAQNPQLISSQRLTEGIESIFHTQGTLFIGSSSGLYIYKIQSNGIPDFTSFSSYDYPILPCDPVVANDSLAFVTVNTTIGNNSPCGVTFVTANALKIFDIKNLNNPILIAEYQMTNPKGVGIDDNLLFICDGEAGLKIFDFTNPQNLSSVFNYPGIDTYDVIPLDGLLIVVGPDNLYQFDYSDLNNIKLVSTISIGS